MNFIQSRGICRTAFGAVFCLFLAACSGLERREGSTQKAVRAQDGLNIGCEVGGRGETALIFLHGWCGDRDYWKNQVDVFAADYRVVTLDQAGHGESGKDRQHWSIRGLAEDVESVVMSLRLKRVILIGHSMGGPVALIAAQRMQGKVVAVIGVDTLQNADAARMSEDAKRQFLSGLNTNFNQTAQGMYSALLHEQTDPKLKQWIADKATAQNQTMAAALMRDLLDLDTKTLLKNANAPIRCINSSGGFRFFVPTAIEINQKYADYKAVFIDSVGHYPMLEKPEEFNQKLRETLREFSVVRD